MTKIHYKMQVITIILIVFLSLILGFVIAALLTISAICTLYPHLDFTEDAILISTGAITLVAFLICHFSIAVAITSIFEKIISLLIRGDLMSEAFIKDDYHPKGFCILHGNPKNGHARALQLAQRHIVYHPRYCVACLRLSYAELQDYIYVMENTHKTVYDLSEYDCDELRHQPALSLRIARRIYRSMHTDDTVFLVYRQRKFYKSDPSVIFLDTDGVSETRC